MYRRKADVDKHVEHLQSKLSSKEFKLRTYSIARLYYDVGDYESCQRYVEEYLKIKDNSAAGHKLLGQALQKLGEKEMALAEYKASMDFDSSQTNLILNICELLLDDELPLDIGRARYWCELAEQNFPNYQVTYRLRERLLSMENPDPVALLKLLKSELSIRPKDVALHQRLLKHHLSMNNATKAFDHAFGVEFSNENSFQNSFIWYESLSEVLTQIDDNKNNSLNYQLLKLTTGEKLCNLSLTEIPSGTCKSMGDTLSYLNKYDQDILKLAMTAPPQGHVEFHSALINHHRGQLCFLLGTYILKKAKKELLKWKEATQIAYPLFLIAWHLEPTDSKAKWIAQSPDKQQVAVRRWNIEGSYRCSQTGYCIIAGTQEKSQNFFLDQITQYCADKHWKSAVYEKVFNSNQFSKKETSFLVKDNKIVPNLRIPRISEIQKYDSEAQKLFPNSLHHLVWILLNYKNLADFKCVLYSMLKPVTRNYTSCGAESLNSLDMDAFLYCAAKTAQYHIDSDNIAKFRSSHPSVIPASITYMLCSVQQMKWWDCASKLCQSQFGHDLTDVRLTISRGIEVIRCVDNHGIDAHLLCILGKVFRDRANNASKVDEKNNFNARANLYFSAAVNSLDKVKNKISIYYPEKRMFDYTRNLSSNEIQNLIEEAKLFIGIYSMNENENEKAIEMFSQLSTPVACFHLSQIFKRLAENEIAASQESLTTEKRSKYASLLTKSKEWAYITLDRLDNCTEDFKHQLRAETQTIIEQLDFDLSKVDLDATNHFHSKNDEKYSSDENASSYESPYNNSIVTNNHSMYPNLSSTPVQKQRSILNNINTKTSDNFDKSYTSNTNMFKIENQIRGLKSAFYEQSKVWAEENHNLAHEVREIKTNLADQIVSSISLKIQDTVDQFKMLKASVNEVKESIGEYRNECQNDVTSLKKDVAELKKDVRKLKSSAPKSEEGDVYQGAECASNFSSQMQFAPSGTLPNFNQRVVPPPGTIPYPLYNPSFFPMYNQLPPPPPMAPLFDPTRQPLNYPGLYADPAIYQDLINTLPTVPPVITPSIPPAIPPVPAVLPPVPSVPANIKPSVAASSKSPTISTSTAKSTNLSLKESNNTLPANVVITSSDPLPPLTSNVSQPVLSVIIPPEHIKSSPHNYQIPMPPNANIASSLFSQGTTMSGAKPFNINDLKMLSSTPNTSTLFQNASPVFKQNSTSTVSWGSPNVSQSRTISEKSNTSVESYDPCPDFKPIVPLPDEVKITTGEENEDVIFSARSKLYRFVDKEWKERGIGEIKLLKNKHTNKVRVLMRREQIHKICANHIITHEMEIKPMKNETKAYFWFANDYADETTVLEKFCIRFKTAEIGKQFYDTFDKARKEAKTTTTEKPPAGTKDLSRVENKQEVLGFGDKFKPVPDSWNCKACYVNNKFDAVKCIACNSDNPNKQNTIDAKIETKSPFVLSQFGIPQTKPIEKKEAEKPNPFSSLNFKTPTTLAFTNIFSNVIPQTKSESIFNVLKSPETKADITETNSEPVNTSDVAEEFVPTAEFSPVVPLPALVERKTGEEDEEVLFEHRAKLLRYDFNMKEWKERGLGNIKLLVQKKDKDKLRLLMRREVVMKVCCNHAVTKDIKFEKMPKMDKAVTWCAKDFSDGELVSETFCLRFKTVKTADDFLKATKLAQETLSSKKEVIREKSVEGVKPVNAGWGDTFKPKPGSWECGACFVRNESTVNYCTACESPKDPNMPKKDSAPAQNANTMKFTFGVPSAVQKAPSLQSAKASFGENKPFSFGLPKTGAGDENIKSAINDTQMQSKPILFAPKETGKFEFTFKSKPSPAPVTEDSPAKSEHGEENDLYASEDEGHHIHFSPVVPMPDKIEVTTGEENEEVLFSHRAKLFKYVEKEWKERGVGDVKILKNKNNGSLRVLMRRDQVHKICLNHALNNDVTYKPKDEKNWIFSASDFSEEKVEMSLFCIRFMNKEVAANFKKAVDSALQSNASPRKENNKEKDDDIQFVTEITTSAEDTERARELMLPDNFFNYKLKEECSGCRGCHQEDESSCSSNSTIVESKKTDTTKPLQWSPEKPKPFSIQNRFSMAANSPVTNLWAVESSTPAPVVTPAYSIFSTPISQTPFSASNTTTISSPYLTPLDKTVNNSIFGGTAKVNVQKQADNSVTFSRQGNLFATPTLGNLLAGSGDSIKKPEKTDDNKTREDITKEASESTPKSTPLFGAGVIKPQNLFSGLGSTAFNKDIEPAKVNGDATKSVSMGTSIFGSNPTLPIQPVSGQSKPLFGMASAANTPSIFAGTNQGQSIFGSKNVSETKTGDSIFNAGAANTAKPLFGTTVPNFGESNKTPGNLFQALNSANAFTGGSLFSSAAAELTKKESVKDKETDKSDENSMLFSALAANGPGFIKKDNFSWEGTGAQLFGGASEDAGDENKESPNTSDAKADEEYDPHYEPIVPLPDKIEVKTGEEDEERLFCERAKLYRFDDNTKEWKERGVGEIKILYHPEKQTYRLLLRREQVHKAVLNMLLFRDFTLLPMKNSDKAWTWAAMNYAENPSGVMEKLSLKFKDSKLKDAFRSKVEECVRKLQAQAAREIAATKGEPFGLFAPPSGQQPAPSTPPQHNTSQPQNDTNSDCVQNCSPFKMTVTPQLFVPVNENEEEGDEVEEYGGQENDYYYENYADDDNYYYDENQQYEEYVYNEEYEEEDEEEKKESRD